ncbi:MAG: N-acetylmuramoyl-L-alanine amidase [Gemmatimonadetes bacterium]|nr:N-acetylmuramoyl-L-alanine amidase [Gemmatimonadota bacterium]
MAVSVNRSLRLPAGEYFPEPQRKSGIAIHHTVCRGARAAFDWWRTDKAPDGSTNHVATAYLIDRDGTVFELFDPEAWAWQFGLAWPDPARTDFEKRFIGIEIASEGALTEHNGDLYALGAVCPQNLRPKTEALDYGRDYRGYRWFARYQPAQLDALGALVDELCTRFAIPRVRPASPFDYYGEAVRDFEGVIGHAIIRQDKTDPAPDPRVWQGLADRARVRSVVVAPSSVSQALDHTALFGANARCLDAMESAAGSLVKDLLMELERRGTFLRLTSPRPHSVGYEVAEGARGPVLPLALSLGLKVTDRTIEVRHA